MSNTRRAWLCAMPFLLPAVRPAAAAATEPDHYFYLGVQGLAADSQSLAQFGVGGAAGYGLRLAGWATLEARLFGNVLHARASSTEDYSQEGLGADLLFPFAGNANSEWFLLAGGGGTYHDLSPNGLDGTSGYANAGLGWRGRARDDAAVRYRVELRAIADTFQSGQDYGQLGLIVEFAPGAAAPATAAAPAALATVRIEPPPVIADEDADGIPDEVDKCSSTLRGAKVEADGCVWKEQVVNMSNVRFASSSNKLTKEGREVLDTVVAFFRSQPDVTMDVYGHTDATGSDALNLKLSKARAAAVVSYLVGKGIAKERLTSDGFGETRPLASNDTEDGKSQNRRVELHIHARAPQ